MRERTFDVQIEKRVSRGRMIGLIRITLDDVAIKMAGDGGVELREMVGPACEFLAGLGCVVVGVTESGKQGVVTLPRLPRPLLDLKKAAGEVPAGNNMVKGDPDAMQSDAGRQDQGEGQVEGREPFGGGGEGGGARAAGEARQGVAEIPPPLPAAGDV